MTRIVKVVLALTEKNEWMILVHKEYDANTNNAFVHTYFRVVGPDIQRALDVAKQMTELEPSYMPIVVDIPSEQV